MLVYFVMAMALYANVAYEEVLRLVIEGLRQLLGDEDLAKAAVTKGAISQARGQVGVAPLRQLYRGQVRPNGPEGMPGVWYAGLRVMAIDGSTLDMPDEAANAKTFGYAAASRGSSAFPQLRFVAMAECGTHTLCYANPGPYATGELTLAESVIDQADATMLVTADRNFFSYAFWRTCRSSMRFESSSAVFPRPPLFPPEQRQFWLDSVLGEIASERAVTSRGKRNPRGVRRKMSNFNLRKRGDPLNQPCVPIPRVECI